MNERIINLPKTAIIYAFHKVTGEIKKVNLLHIGQRQFNCSDEQGGKWYSYSKRGEWELFYKPKSTRMTENTDDLILLLKMATRIKKPKDINKDDGE